MSKQVKNSAKTVSSLIVDSSSGEVIEERVSTETVSYEAEQLFMKVYQDGISKTRGLTSGERDVLDVLMKVMDYKNMVILIGPKRDEVMRESGVTSKVSFDRALRGLKSHDIITPVMNLSGTPKVEKGFYRVNPFVCSKGRWRDVKQLRGLYSTEYYEFHTMGQGEPVGASFFKEQDKGKSE